MPIERKPGETKDEWMGKCIGIEINNGKDPSQAAAICYAKWDEMSTDLKGKTQSVTDNTWSTEAPISVNMAKVSYDYDGTLSTTRGKEMAKSAAEVLGIKTEDVLVASTGIIGTFAFKEI